MTHVFVICFSKRCQYRQGAEWKCDTSAYIFFSSLSRNEFRFSSRFSKFSFFLFLFSFFFFILEISRFHQLAPLFLSNPPCFHILFSFSFARELHWKIDLFSISCYSRFMEVLTIRRLEFFKNLVTMFRCETRAHIVASSSKRGIIFKRQP